MFFEVDYKNRFEIIVDYRLNIRHKSLKLKINHDN